jgi:aminopeptidase N
VLDRGLADGDVGVTGGAVTAADLYTPGTERGGARAALAAASLAGAGASAPGGPAQVASALWVPGQEGLLAGYRDRFFAEALPVLDRLGIRQMRRLARALYPVTLAEPATLAATAAAAGRDDLSRGLRVVLEEQEVILRSALAARSTPRRWP